VYGGAVMKNRRYCICDNNGIPIGCQPEKGYTMTQAIERYNREVDEDVRLFSERFGVTKKEIERDIQIRDIKTFERVL
jgi:hypothetical protein